MNEEDASLPAPAGRKEGKGRGCKSPVIPRYRRASTGTCHDSCKHGGTHQLQKSVTNASSKQLKPYPRRSSATLHPAPAQKKKKKEKPSSFSGNSGKAKEADVKEKTLYMITPEKPKICTMRKKKNNLISEINQGEIIMLKRQDSKKKKVAVHGLFNDVIQSTARKLAKTRASKVKALVGAFETVISLQETKSNSPPTPAAATATPAADADANPASVSQSGNLY